MRSSSSRTSPVPRSPLLHQSISSEEIREYFECPVCLLVRKPLFLFCPFINSSTLIFKVPRPGRPIYSCLNGHLVCSECTPRIQSCPICRAPINENNRMRLYFAERFIEDKVPNECKFSEFGCDVCEVGAELLRHEKDCAFEPLNCDFNHRGCQEKVARAKKTDHLAICDFRLCDCPMPECKAKVIHKNLITHLREFHFGLDTTHYFMHIFLISLAINIVIYIVMYFLM